MSTQAAMQPRKKQKKTPSELPQEFKRNVSKLFNDQFEKERGEATFSTLGELYPNEAVLCICLMHVGTLRAASFYLSVDLVEEKIKQHPERVTEKLKQMVDLAASWFDQNFKEGKEKGLEAILDALSDIAPDWQEAQWENGTYYVLLNRDNQTLETAADMLLSEDEDFGDDEEF